MAKNDTLLIAGAVGLGAWLLKDSIKGINTAFQGVGQGVGQGVRDAVGGTGQAIKEVMHTTSERYEQVTSPAQNIQAASDLILFKLEAAEERAKLREGARQEHQGNVGHTQGRTDERKATGEYNRTDIAQSGQTARAKIRNDIATGTLKTVYDAGRDIKSTFTSIFRPNRQQIDDRRAKLKDTLKVIHEAPKKAIDDAAKKLRSGLSKLKFWR